MGGTIESSDEEESEVKVEKVAVKQEEKETKHIVSKPTISEDWMIDDVETIESSDEEESEVKVDKVAVKQEQKEEKNIVSKPTISEDWMIDDVGTMESSDEEETEVKEDNSKSEKVVQGDLPENEKSGLTKLNISEYWMIDDVGTMESSGDEQDISNEKMYKDTAKPLPITAPLYSDIASKLPKPKIEEDTVVTPTGTIAVGDHYKPIIFSDVKEKID